ncbi:MAG: transcription antitermination factor NusB [Chromatiales bacterium]|nr:transcription antitermination factor NusB [Chromatiales bacterium]
MGISARTRARRLTVQALYQWQMAGQALADIEAQFLEEQDLRNTEVGYFQELLHEIPRNLAEMDDYLRPCLDRALESVDPVELAVLRLGVFELRYRHEIPYKVVINEAVELAKRYGAADGHAFVNGILDRLAPQLRSVETGDRPAPAPVKPKVAPTVVKAKPTVKITHKPKAEPVAEKPSSDLYKGPGRDGDSQGEKSPWSSRPRREREVRADEGAGPWPKRPRDDAGPETPKEKPGIWPSAPPGDPKQRS